MKTLLENSAVFGFVLLAVYIIIDVTDARWFIPHLRDKCSGALTEQQENICYHWLYIKRKDNGHTD